MGICGADQGASLEQLIVDNEMAAYVKRVLRGFAVNEETLAQDVIKRIGIGGNYLADAHTVTHFRQELWFPEGFDRRSWEEWWDDGAPSMVDWARGRKETILVQHRPKLIEAQLALEIDRIVDIAGRELGKT
jgi:trimethylamine--corrinoid protein Co-methyltransferase